MKEQPMAEWRVAVDDWTESEWAEVVSQFDDAFLFQTWAYGAVRWGEVNLSRLVLYRGDTPVAAAQARIVRASLVRTGLAYVYWGPMWQRRGEDADVAVLEKALIALQNEYVTSRGFALRIVFKECPELVADAAGILSRLGFSRRMAVERRTVLIDLTRDPDEMRKGLRGNWRRDLVASERNPAFEVEVGDSDALYDTFVDLYNEMHARKGFIEHVDVNEYREINARLTQGQKLGVMVCRHDGRPVAGVVWSAIGGNAFLHFAATIAEGRNLKAGYYIKWRELMWLKERGYHWYDFGGVDPEQNPGGYRSKTGVMGNKGQNGMEVGYLGQYDCADSASAKLVLASVDRLQDAKRRVQSWRQRRGK